MRSRAESVGRCPASCQRPDAPSKTIRSIWAGPKRPRSFSVPPNSRLLMIAILFIKSEGEDLVDGRRDRGAAPRAAALRHVVIEDDRAVRPVRDLAQRFEQRTHLIGQV